MAKWVSVLCQKKQKVKKKFIIPAFSSLVFFRKKDFITIVYTLYAFQLKNLNIFFIWVNF